jgi:hypothetical protein
VPYPSDGQVFSLDEQFEITLQADVQDGIGIRQVVWIVDGDEVSDQVQPPYTLVWPLVAGEHTLEVKAYDLAGHVTYSDQATFTVEP